MFTDGNQLRQVNAPSFILHIWLNEGDRAQTALSMKMSTEMKIMVTMMVFGTISDNRGVRNCSKNGKDNNNGSKNKKVIKLGRLWIKDEIFSELNK